MLDLWDYRGHECFSYGDNTTYEKAMAFLDGPGILEDWGCGTAYAKRFVKAASYIGIDGSGGFCNIHADLVGYRSQADFILIRHVLDHNRQWRVVLENALFSAQKRLCIILFTPFQNETTTIGMNFNEIPDIGFRLADITDLIEGRGAYAVETVNTETQYGVEHLIYVTIKQCMASVTALIKTFLRDKYLFNCVRSLKSQAPNIRIVVADDGHVSDQKERTLNELGVDRYIQLPFNSAPIAKARNLMVDAAETEHVLIGDDDFTYTPASNLVNMCSLMNLADIAGGAIMQSDEVLHYEGVFEREGHNMMLRPLRGSYQNQGQTRYIQADYVYNFFVAKTSALRKVRWDKRIRASYEHEDFFLSAKEAGLKVVYCPNSVVLHRYGPQDSPEYQRYRYSGDIQDKSSFESKWGFGLSF